jgi:hypothetical protein
MRFHDFCFQNEGSAQRTHNPIATSSIEEIQTAAFKKLIGMSSTDENDYI